MSKNISQRLEPEAHLSQSLPAQAGLTSLPGLANPAEAGGAGWRKLKYYYERKK